MSHRILQIIVLREQGKTYAEIGATVGLSQGSVSRIVAKHSPSLTGHHQALLRNHEVITYAEIGKRLGLTLTSVGLIVRKYVPSLAGPGQVPRPLKAPKAQRYRGAPRPTDDVRSYRRWYYQNVVRSRAHLAPIADGKMSRSIQLQVTDRPGRRPAMPVTMVTLPIDLVLPPPLKLEKRLHGQTSANEDDELRHSIRRFGVLTPIVVRSTGNGMYVIMDGLRRYCIAQALGLSSIDCAINWNADASTHEHIRFELESTFKPLTAAEYARQQRRLQELGA
jgi:hypothetical protein